MEHERSPNAPHATSTRHPQPEAAPGAASGSGSDVPQRATPYWPAMLALQLAQRPGAAGSRWHPSRAGCSYWPAMLPLQLAQRLGARVHYRTRRGRGGVLAGHASRSSLSAWALGFTAAPVGAAVGMESGPIVVVAR